MKSIIYILIIISSVVILIGCETLDGITRDAANTTKNLRDIFQAGKTIGDVIK